MTAEQHIEVMRLVESEQAKLEAFFGREVEVPLPPIEAVKNLEFWKKNGFELHYLPAMNMQYVREKESAPGWKVPPEQSYWDRIGGSGDDGIDPNAAQIEGGWMLIDGRQKPAYDAGNQKYANDELLEGVLPGARRFNLSWEVIQGFEPEIAKALKVSAADVRLPRVIEFNVLGNIHHPEWGTTDTWEWLEDENKSWHRLSGGNSDYGGLAHVDASAPTAAGPRIGFRPVVVFK